MRLDKVLAKRNFGSRKEVKKLIKNRAVTINEQIVVASNYDVSEGLQICINNECFRYQQYEYLVFNKPRGCVSANTDNIHQTLFAYLPNYYAKDFHIVGRLDVDTEGLVILTNDGKFTHQVISPTNQIGKEYYVKLAKIVSKDYVEQFRAGITLSDHQCLSAKLIIIDEYTCLLTIYEGKFHQVKRMFHALDNEVIYLKRTAIGQITLEDLAVGAYKKITKANAYALCTSKKERL